MSVDEPRGVGKCWSLGRRCGRILVLPIDFILENIGLLPKTLVFCYKIIEMSSYSASWVYLMAKCGVYLLLVDFDNTILFRVDAFGLSICLSTAVTGASTRAFNLSRVAPATPEVALV